MLANWGAPESLGLDYGYWDTFWKQYHGAPIYDFFDTFPASTVFNQLIQDWPNLPGNPADIREQVRYVYGVYLLALQAKNPPYELNSRAAGATLRFVLAKSGAPRGVVVAVLSTLEKMAKSGAIEARWWNPGQVIAAQAAAKAQAKAVRATRPPTPARDTVQAVETAAASAGGFFTGTLKWVALGAIGIGGAMLVSKLPKFGRR